MVIGIIAVIVAAGSALYILYKDNSLNKSNTSPTPVVSATVAQSATASTSATATATQSAGASQTSFKYTDEKIRIANGNGISGEAAKIKGILEAAGFEVASTGNASKTYEKSIIFYKNGQEDLANALKAAIKNNYTADVEQSDSTVGTYDAVIALGSK